MNPQRVTHLDPWEDRELRCNECGWSGCGRDASTEYFTELVAVRCPTCDGKFFLVVNPTRDETERAAAAGHGEAITHLRLLDDMDEAHARIIELRKGRDHLPAVEGSALEFTFTPEGGSDDLNPNWLVLTCNGAEIYREPTAFEGWRAIVEIGQNVLEQYPGRVAWIDPGRAGDCLGGDEIYYGTHIRRFLDDNDVAPPIGNWATRTAR